jgi:uncharacterized lipoprotein YmbA
MKKMHLLLPALLLLLTGCASHYLVRDPASGNTYYTRDIDRAGDAGSVKFTDAATGSRITIQQSEVQSISEDQYESGIKRGR